MIDVLLLAGWTVQCTYMGVSKTRPSTGQFWGSNMGPDKPWDDQIELFRADPSDRQTKGALL